MGYISILKESAPEFFAKLVRKDTGYKNSKGVASPCLEYTGTLYKNGYGRVYKLEGAPKETKAHRYSFIMAKGKIPKRKGKSLLILHRCDNRVCCNPNHIFASDHRQNMIDMVTRGRSAKGESHGNSRMTDAEVSFIKLLRSLSFSYQEIADITLIPKSTASRFNSAKAWAHVRPMDMTEEAVNAYIVNCKNYGVALRPARTVRKGANASSASISVSWVRQCVVAFGQVETAAMLNSTRKKIRVILEKDDSDVLLVDPKTKQMTALRVNPKITFRDFILARLETQGELCQI